MHTTEEVPPTEEARLNQAMTSMDPILQASLQREQQRRRKKLLYGGIAMATLVALLAVIFSQPGSTVNGDTSDAPADPVARIAQAEQLGKEGWQLWSSGQSAAAEKKFVEAMELDKLNPNTFNGLGWSRIHQAKYDRAIESFEKCLKLQRNHAGALNGIGQAHLFKRDYDIAEPYLRRSAAATKGPSAAEYGLARIYLLTEQFPKAKATLTKMKKKGLGEFDSGEIDAMVEAATAESVSDELLAKLEPPAIDAATTQVAEDGKSAADWNSEGWSYFQGGNARAAEAAFTKALKLAPKMEAAQNGLGFALLNQNKHKEAFRIFEKLVKSDPKGAGYVNGLARCYQQAGDLEKAVTTWKTLETGEGPVTALTWGLGRSLLELDRKDEALAIFERIKKQNPNEPGIDGLIEKCKAGE